MTFLLVYNTFTQKIHTVDLAQVNQAARELIYPDKIVIVTAALAVLAHSRWWLVDQD